MANTLNAFRNGAIGFIVPTLLVQTKSLSNYGELAGSISSGSR